MARIASFTNSNPKTCPICQHTDRAEIERLILSMSPSNPALTLDAIADTFDVSSQELRVHALMHTPLALDFSDKSEAALIDNFKSRAGVQPSESNSSIQDAASDCNIEYKDRLVDKVNLREGDMLLAAATEMLGTLSVLGRRIKRYASDSSDGGDQRLAAFCSNAMVNLYVNTSTELRKNIQAINELNTSVNGEGDAGSAGLIALAKAVQSSACNQSSNDEE